MEDDDEFGDLYTDVLTTFPSSPSPASQPQSTVPASSRPIDLNLESDDADAPYDTCNSRFTSSQGPDGQPSIVARYDVYSLPPNSKLEDREEGEKEELAGGETTKNSGSDSAAAISETRVLQNADFNLEKDARKLDTGDNKDGDFGEGEQKFGTEEELTGDLEDLGSEPIIPGLYTGPSAPETSDMGLVNRESTGNFISRPDRGGGGDCDDWDSDSEDDLQIVLNDNNHGPMGMDGNEMIVGSDDEDEDGEPLVIVADDDAGHQAAEEQDWGEDAGQAAEGKETTDAAKANGGLAPAPRIGYGNYGYHPFHSQFKYVRPGAAPLPGGPPGSSGGALGQVRPPANMSTMPGRGRGDWRPPGMRGSSMQKGFHPGFWGSSVPGRGLEFTLPSHKTIFDVDIDSFEEKPWKYHGADISDFFNFGLTEESWKEYCKQLEQLRLESTMQSKIRVYESGRADQEYDPDLPPELAAAAGIHDSSAENVDIAKADGGIGDLAKGSARVRPPLPTGRAIQVETGYGERLPSVDTRPPRIRDSDAVIEIVLQDTMEDESAGNDATEHLDDDFAGGGNKVDIVDEDGRQDGDECSDGYPQAYGGTQEDVDCGRSPIVNALHDINEEERDASSPHRASSDYHSGSRGHTPKDAGSPNDKRWITEKAHKRSPDMSSGESALDRRSLDYQQEESTESMERKHNAESSCPAPPDAQEASLDGKAASDNVAADTKSGKGKEDIDAVASTNSSEDKHRLNFSQQRNLRSRVDHSAIKEIDDEGDFKASRSSDTSKATGSSKDQQKVLEGIDDEVLQNGRSTYMGNLKRHRGESGHDSRRKDRDGRLEIERNYMLAKGREEYYPHRDSDPYAAKHFHLKSDGHDWRKERDYSEVSWQRRDEDRHAHRNRAEDARKHEHADELVSRHRGKVRENDRSDKDEYLHSRKRLDNGSWRGYHDKDVGLRCREKDDNLKILDDPHSKRRKEDSYMRREHAEKDVLLTHKESSSSRRKREREENQRKRDDQPRVKDSMDDHHSVRLKDEVWLQRERAQQQRERDGWYLSNQLYEETMLRREREDTRGSIRSSRNVEEKSWIGHSREREEYNGHDKDRGRHGEQAKRRDHVEDDTSLQHRGIEDVFARENQLGDEGKRSRQERPNPRKDRSLHASDNQRMHENRHKDSLKKSRESEGRNISGSSKRHQAEKGAMNEMADVKRVSEHAEVENESSMHTLTREGRDVSSDDEQHGSRRGRSKLERWTSHKEKDYDINSKSSSSLKIKEFSKDKLAGSGSGSGSGSRSSTRVQDESAKAETADHNQSLGGGSDGGHESKDANAKPPDDRHLDTVEKLKRRSERFKQPLTSSEKDALAIKKMESEPLSSSVNEPPASSEVKQERPARKRRWISS